jgi:hypothetical protein
VRRRYSRGHVGRWCVARFGVRRVRVVHWRPAADTEYLIATPVQGLRAAMRLYETRGLGGFTLCLMDLFAGARWGELVGQQAHEYDAARQAINIRTPLIEVGGQLSKAARASPNYPHSSRPQRNSHAAPEAGNEDAPKHPPGLASSNYRPALPCSTNYCSTAIHTSSCSPPQKDNHCGDPTSGNATGDPPGTASTPACPAHRTISRRSCPGSPSTKAATPTPPGSPKTASPKSPAEPGSDTK